MEVLRRIYYDPKNPGAFASEQKLYHAAKTEDPTITHKQVEDFLSSSIPYTLHKKIVRKFKRNPVIASRPWEHAQCDLIDVQRYTKSNKGYNYILTLVDVFTKKAYAEPLKTKSGQNVKNALEKIFENDQPEHLQTDEGTEFTNKIVQEFLKQRNVHFFLAKNERIKCAIVERFQRTLMTKIHRYFTANGTHKYIDKLQDFITAYNNSEHRMTNMTPNEITDDDAPYVFNKLYGFKSKRELIHETYKNKTKLIEGDKVRIPETKNKFAKGYAQNFSDRIYTVTKSVIGLNKPNYVLKEADGTKVHGKFYPEEAQRIKDTETYRVHVIRTRKRGRQTQYLIEYEGYPEEGQQWITEAQLQELTD